MRRYPFICRAYLESSDAREIKQTKVAGTAKDNKTLLEKSHLRKEMLAKLETDPCVLETHGGTGELFPPGAMPHVKARAQSLKPMRRRRSRF